MFALTGSATEQLVEAVKKEQKAGPEKLYVRLSMGIG